MPEPRRGVTILTMKRLTLLACALLLLAGSCGTGNRAKIAPPELELYQMIGPADLNYPRGAIEVQFALKIANKSAEPITLRQIQMMPVGMGGPYRIESHTYYFNSRVAGNASQDVPFWARATASGDAHAIDVNAPVSVRAVALFESESGRFQRILMKTFSQHGTGPRSGQ